MSKRRNFAKSGHTAHQNLLQIHRLEKFFSDKKWIKRSRRYNFLSIYRSHNQRDQIGEIWKGFGNNNLFKKLPKYLTTFRATMKNGPLLAKTALATFWIFFEKWAALILTSGHTAHHVQTSEGEATGLLPWMQIWLLT